MKPSPSPITRRGRWTRRSISCATLDNARVLAGGQSLMPMMNYRVVQPEHLIDLGRIAELALSTTRPRACRSAP